MSIRKLLKKLDKAAYKVLAGKRPVRVKLFNLPEKVVQLRTLIGAGALFVALVLFAALSLAGGKPEREVFLAKTPAPDADLLAIPAPKAQAAYSPPPTPTPSPTPNPYAPLNPDTRDLRVVDLQARLMSLDYMEADEPTDYYGGITKYAVQLFQREHGLQVDGWAGEETLRLLYSNEAKPYVVRLNDRGTDVKEFQIRLRELRYLSAKATGVFGTDTEAAVKEFQKRNKLKEDGKIGSNTREAIYDEDAVPKPTPKPNKPGITPKPGAKATKKPSKPAINPPNGDNAAAMIKFAKAYLGYSYTRGGKGPTEFDCSGFVYWCLKNNGVNLRYMTSSAWAKSSYPTVSSFSKLEPGDILCYRGHVGIYIGGGQMIDASSSKGQIRIASNISGSSYWSRNFICAKRVY